MGGECSRTRCTPVICKRGQPCAWLYTYTHCLICMPLRAARAPAGERREEVSGTVARPHQRRISRTPGALYTFLAHKKIGIRPS